jgi:hypothetical protein
MACSEPWGTLLRLRPSWHAEQLLVSAASAARLALLQRTSNFQNGLVWSMSELPRLHSQQHLHNVSCDVTTQWSPVTTVC